MSGILCLAHSGHKIIPGTLRCFGFWSWRDFQPGFGQGEDSGRAGMAVPSGWQHRHG